MINKKEIFGLVFIFIFVYFIIWIDHRLYPKCKCEECDFTSNVSIKIPLLITALGLVGIWFGKPYILPYISNNLIVKQDIITEMADF